MALLDRCFDSDCSSTNKRSNHPNDVALGKEAQERYR